MFSKICTKLRDIIVSPVLDIIDAINRLLQLICGALLLFLVFRFLQHYIFIDPTGLVSGGFFAGLLHALSGPDHIAAILPTIAGKDWFYAATIGFAWSLGHICSSFFLAIFGNALEGSLLRGGLISYLLQFADVIVGGTLIVIGFLGIIESISDTIEKDELINGNSSSPILPVSNVSSSPIDNSSYAQRFKKFWSALCWVYVSIFVNGLILGFSLDGIPSLTPTLTAVTWQSLLNFLVAYAVGTIGSMTFIAGLIGYFSSIIGQSNQSSLPKRLSFATSVVAILIGLIWIIHTSLRLSNVDDFEVVANIMNYALASGTPVIIFLVIVATIGGRQVIRSLSWNWISISSCGRKKEAHVV